MVHTQDTALETSVAFISFTDKSKYQTYIVINKIFMTIKFTQHECFQRLSKKVIYYYS